MKIFDKLGIHCTNFGSVTSKFNSDLEFKSLVFIGMLLRNIQLVMLCMLRCRVVRKKAIPKVRILAHRALLISRRFADEGLFFGKKEDAELMKVMITERTYRSEKSS